MSLQLKAYSVLKSASLVGVFALFAAVVFACGATQNASGKLNVVTTVAPITSIIENIGGDRIQLQGIVPEGTNSHTYEPSPSIAKTLAQADLIIANGLFLEEPTINMAESVKQDDTPILLLGDNTITRDQWAFDFTFPESGEHPNPHLWPNPNLALQYAQLVHDTLVSLDTSNQDYYSDNLAAFTVRIDRLDNAIREGISTISPDNRRLLTYHDSWAYFAPHLRRRDHRRNPAVRFQRTLPPGNGPPHPPGPRPRRSRRLRLRGLSQQGSRTDRPRGRSPIQR